jgi:myosin heavy subunit
MDYVIYSIEETCVTAIKIADGTKVSFEYTTAEDGQIALGETEFPVFHLIVTEEEFNSYSQNMEELTSLRNEKSEFDGKLSEKDTTISTLETEKATLEDEKATYEATIATHEITISNLQGEVDSLKNYKNEVEENQKKLVIAKYAKKLDQETLDSYNLADWTVEALDKELSFVFVNKNSQLLFGDDSNGFVPKDANKPKEGLEGILSKYRH